MKSFSTHILATINLIFWGILSAYSQPHYNWVKSVVGVYTDTAYCVETDEQGNVYVAGRFSRQANFNPNGEGGRLTADGPYGEHGFLLKYNSLGNFVWVKKIAGPFETIFNKLLLKNGNILLLGHFRGTADFDPGPDQHLLNQNLYGVSPFVAKYDTAGNFIWARTFNSGGVLGEFGLSHLFLTTAVCTKQDEYYVIGSFKDTIDFDPGLNSHNMISKGEVVLCILKLSTDGKFVWAKQHPGSQFDWLLSGDIDSNDEIVLAGSFSNTISFNRITDTLRFTSHHGSTDIFVAKFDTTGNVLWANQFGSINYDYLKKLKIDANDNIITMTYNGDSMDIDPSQNMFILSQGNAISKFDSSGRLIWAKRFLEDHKGSMIDFATDFDNNIYATGGFNDSVSVNPDNPQDKIYPKGHTDFFILKLDQYGAYNWSVSITSNSVYKLANAITIDMAGSIYTTGVFFDTVDFDPSPEVKNLYGINYSEVFVLKLGKFPNTKTHEINNIVPLVNTYPNPVNEKLYIEVLSKADLRLNLYTISGQLVEKGLYKFNSTELDMRALQPGLYFLSICIGEECKVFKIVKQ